MCDVNVTGLYCFGLILLSPLCMGVTIPCFSSVGILPWSIDDLHKLESGFDNAFAHFLRRIAGIWSGSAAASTFIFDNAFSKSSGLCWMSLNW